MRFFKRPPTQSTIDRRFIKLVQLANLGKQDELRVEFEEFHESFAGTRQAMELRLLAFAELTGRPCFPDGRPIGTMGYKLLKRLRDEKKAPEDIFPAILAELLEKRRVASVHQALEWLLSPQTP